MVRGTKMVTAFVEFQDLQSAMACHQNLQESGWTMCPVQPDLYHPLNACRRAPFACGLE